MSKVTKIDQIKAQEKQKLRVAAYCRVSTAYEEQLESLETQKTYFENYIKSRDDWELVDIYFDEGISGTKKDKRQGLMRMLQDCDNHLIDFVITKSISRFSRNTTDCLELVRRLQQLNIPLYFERENLNTADMESELILAVLSSMAECEASSVSQNAKWSIQKRFQGGTYKISYPPYGYMWNGTEMIIDPNQAEIVKEIFSSYLTGKGTDTIAKELNARGIETKRGGKWSGTTVSSILTNEKYTGDVIFQKTYTDENYIRHRNTGEVDSYICHEHHDAIISHADFDKVAELMAQHRAEKNISQNNIKYQARYALSGKLICGECGNILRRRINSTGTRKYAAWLCNTHLSDSHACSMLYIRNDNIECAFITMLNKLIFARNKLLKPLMQDLKSYRAVDDKTEIYTLEEELLRLNEQRDTLQRLMAKGYLDQVLYTKQMNGLMSQAEHCRNRLKILQRTTNNASQRITALEDLVRFAEHNLILTAFDGELFTRFVTRAVIISRKEIIFELKCGLKLKERI